MSMSKRLIVVLTVLLASLWLASAMISRAVILSEVDEIYAENLSTTAIRFMPLFIHAISGRPDGGEVAGGPSELDQDLRFFRAGRQGYLAYEVRNRNGTVVLRSYDAQGYRFPTTMRTGYIAGRELLSYTVTDEKTGLTLTVAEPAAHRREAIRDATTALFAPLLLPVPLVIAGLLLLTRYTLAPLRTLRQQISTRGGSNFDPIGSSGRAQELVPITQAVDRLLDRVKFATDEQRGFAADSARELGAPLASAVAATHLLKSEVATDRARCQVVALEASLKRLSGVADKLTEFSRVRLNAGPARARANMTPVLHAVVAKLAEVGKSRAVIEVENKLNQDLMVAMNPEAFGAALGNLLEAAIIHSGSRQPVRLVIERDWSIRVVRQGDAAPASSADGLENRVVPVTSNAEGAGLALAIAGQFMADCGGALLLRAPADDLEGGFEAVMRLP